MLIVRDYNNIMFLINPKERALFNDHLTQLDRIIQPGLDKWEWLNFNEGYVPQCRVNCLANFKQINDFQIRNTKIKD
jgi:hypothetical protein